MQKIILIILGLGVIVGLGFSALKLNNKVVEEGVGEPTEIPEKPTTVSEKCFVGGCSNQICSDQKDVVSTCEWTEKYACYQTVTCERQANGKCGWTETPVLKECLSKSGDAVIY